MSVLEGVMAVHKPTGISSFDVIRTLTPLFRESALFQPLIAREKAKCDAEEARQLASAIKHHKQWRKKNQIAKRNKLAQLRVGHGGTLDPLATGVLIVGVGKGTKCLQSFLNGTKEYECVVLFGAETDTYDREGKVTAIKACDHVTRASVLEAIESLKMKKTQLPPKYSSIRVKGKHLYDYARNGEEVPEIKAREVSLYEAELLEWLEPDQHHFELPSQEAKREEEILEGRQTWSKSLMHKRKRDDEVTGDTEAPNAKIARTSSPTTGAGTEDITKEAESTIAETIHSQPESKASVEVAFTTSETSPGGASIRNSNGPPDTDRPRPKAARIRLKVSSGYYVRSFCHDLGKEVGSAGIMEALVRTRCSEFELGKNVIDYGEFEKDASIWQPQVEEQLQDWMDKNGTGVPEEDANDDESRRKRKEPTTGERRTQRREDHEMARARLPMRNSSSPE